MELGITEMFSSIQGEGVYTGRPSLFIRLEGCNLNCKWCDTPRRKSDSEITNDSIKRALKNNPHDDIVITGGEPLINQLRVKHILRQVQFALGRKHPLVTIETNGTMIPSKAITTFDNRIFWSVSPKLSSSGESFNRKAFEWFANKPQTQFKFVIGSDSDFKEFVREVWNIGYDTPIILQPCCPNRIDIKEYLDLYRDLINKVRDEKLMHNIQVMPQMHKLAFGFNTEGV